MCDNFSYRDVVYLCKHPELAGAEPIQRTVHKIKILPPFYQDVLFGRKRFEIRKNDRNYQEGDLLVLQEWEHEYTGREVRARVDYLLKDSVFAGLMPGYVIMSITVLSRNSPTTD